MFLLHFMLFKILSINEGLSDEYKTAFTTFRTEIETGNYFIHVSNSFFKGISKGSSGSVIYYSVSDGKLFVEFTTFNNCYITGSSSHGGCIYASNCDCVIYCICSNKCYAQDTWGQFISTELSTTQTDRINFFISSSVCFTPEGRYGHTIHLEYGKQFCTSTNVSQNEVKLYWSGIVLQFGTGTPLVSFCSFNSNTAYHSGCIYLSTADYVDVYEMMNCNIISNTQTNQQERAIIMCQRPTNIYFCCILGNTNWRLFQALAQITLFDCTIPNQFTVISSNYLDTNEAGTESFINNLKFTYKEGNCDVGLESYYDLTPVYDESITIDPLRESLSEEEEKYSKRNNIFMLSRQRNRREKSDTYVLKGSLPNINTSFTKAKEDNETRKEIVQSHHKYLSRFLTFIKLLLSPTFLFHFVIHSLK